MRPTFFLTDQTPNFTKMTAFWPFLGQNGPFLAKPLAEFRPKFAKRCVSKSWAPNQSIKCVTLSEKNLGPKNLFFTPVLYNKDIDDLAVCCAPQDSNK